MAKKKRRKGKKKSPQQHWVSVQNILTSLLTASVVALATGIYRLVAELIELRHDVDLLYGMMAKVAEGLEIVL